MQITCRILYTSSCTLFISWVIHGLFSSQLFKSLSLIILKSNYKYWIYCQNYSLKLSQRASIKKKYSYSYSAVWTGWNNNKSYDRPSQSISEIPIAKSLNFLIDLLNLLKMLLIHFPYGQPIQMFSSGIIFFIHL